MGGEIGETSLTYKPPKVSSDAYSRKDHQDLLTTKERSNHLKMNSIKSRLLAATTEYQK